MSMRRLPPLSALRAFEAAARHQSAKQAAEELSVTPTAISHQIRQLEEHLGIALFVRKPRQLLLTPEGRELQLVLFAALTNIGDTIDKLQRQKPRQTITLTTTPAVAARWLLPWVCLLRDAHPLLDLRIHASHAPVALDGVSADMALRYGSGAWAGLVTEKLFDNLFIPACSPALNLKDICHLPQHTLLHFEPRQAVSRPVDWSQWQQHARVPGLDVRSGITFSDETHAVTAALDGQGIALMSEALIRDELRAGRLVQPFGPALPAEPFHLVYPVHRKTDPLILAVRDWVISLIDRVCER